MKNKIIGALAAPVLVPLMLIQIDNAGKPSKYEREQAKRARAIEKMRAGRRGY